MTHQTGIRANDELLRFFGSCRNGNIRTFSILIEKEELKLGESLPAKGKWEDEYDQQVVPLLKEKQPCYIMFRLDSNAHGSFKWVLLCWSPDDSPIRQKMLYASTKSSFKKEFGATQISEEVFGSVVDDVNLEGLLKHQQSAKAPPPLTMAEEEMNEIKNLEVGVDISVDTKQQTLAGVAFPMLRDALEAIKKFSKGDYQYLRLKIDLSAEEIQLEKTKASLSLSELPGEVPDDHARYHLYRFDHNYEGDYFHSVLFVYSCPGYNCPVKERMLYSSSKNPVIEYMENTANLEITKKLEVGEAAELTEEYILDEIHPKKNLHRPKFERPKGPANRGAKRITKQPIKPEDLKN